MLTSLAQIKSFLNIPGSDTSQDRQLSSLQYAAESVIKSRLKRNLELSTYTEFYAGNSQRALTLRQRPVLSIASIYEDFNAFFGQKPDSFGPATLLQPGHHYALDLDTTSNLSHSGIIFRIGGVWQEIGRVYFPGKLAAEIGPTFGNLKITYTAGYSEIPQDLQYAVCYLISFMRRNVEAGGSIESETIGDYEYKLFDPSASRNNPLLSSVDQILTRYREQAL